MDTLADILAIKFAGNYADDCSKFTRINRFLARPDVTPDERWQADYHASFNGMGEHMTRQEGYYEDVANFRAD